ncbi:two-component system response regulator BaeR [Pseudoalteromonas luteoviolacea]|uniref:Two-component system response regulator BaeR n=1 Tax=Pseudoalteromonas luteoviolacea TaxID=43657 RepID=A0A1C0TVV8_9GAMM|nr:response regulator [Pseudoalteromonas luteoviolacea]MBQ4809976.1 response regulator [Pseudoalteromonas luteoviolacea]OCQ23456.1 two-component system response regulator BaeR [Pseudoalteromonas luteoviolacea]
MKKQKVLIVEDEEKLAKILGKYLEQAGYEYDIVMDGAHAMKRICTFLPDIILLDLMLPSVDGIQICSEVRKDSAVPIIMTTAKVEEIDRLLGLEVGADDYVCKPYSPKEVVARVKAVLRRTSGSGPIQTGLHLDEETLFVNYAGNRTDLTHVEFMLLQTMFKHPGRVYNRARLMDSIYDDDRVVSDRTIDSHIKKIRKKLHDIAPDCEFIHSIYGVGYKFEV